MASRAKRTRSVDRNVKSNTHVNTNNNLPQSSHCSNSNEWYVLVDRLLQKDMIPPPKTFYSQGNINSHIKALERYMSAVHITNSKSKSATLINTLDEEVQTRLFAQSGFEAHESDYEWVKEELISIYQKKSSLLSPLVYLLGKKQLEGQSVDEFATNLRVEAYRHWPQHLQHKKEEALVSAFLNGINNKNVALAVQGVYPESLDAATQLVKKS